VADQRFEQSKRRTDFIKASSSRSCLPSIEAITRSVTRATDMRVVDLEDMRRHYAETLNAGGRTWARPTTPSSTSAWRGLSPHVGLLPRLCEAGFLERQVSDVQLVLTARLARAGAGAAGPLS